MTSPDPAALAVLLDAARTVLGEVEATPEEVVLWLRHAKAVRTLLSRAPLQPDDGDVSCGSCGRNWEDAHSADCAFMRALELLDHPRGHAEVGRAWDLAALRQPHWNRILGRPGATLAWAANVAMVNPRAVVPLFMEARSHDCSRGHAFAGGQCWRCGADDPSFAPTVLPEAGSARLRTEYLELLRRFPEAPAHDCRRDGHSFAVGTCEHCGADDPRFTSPRD